MLNIFRRGFVSKIMLGVLAIGVFAILITGFGTDGMGGLGGMAGGASGDTLVSIEGEKVTSLEMTDQINRQLARAREQQPELDMGTFLRTGAYEEILRQLVAQKAMLAFAEKIGIVASKRMIDGEIASIPAFKNLAGQFDQNAFQTALQREGISEAQLRQELAATLIQRQILLPAAASARVPQEMALQYASLLLEQRSGTVGLVPAAAMGTGREPTDAEVAAFYRENQSRYTIPERRVLRYAMIGPEQVAGSARATEAEIAAAYQANQDKYGAKESRTLSQVIFPTQAAAQGFAAQVAGGTSFAAAAGANLIAVEKQTKAQFTNLTSPAVANAAYSAPQGAVTPPIQSPFGWHVVRVEAIERAPATPLAAARAELEAQITQRKQTEALGALVTRIEDALSEGSSFEEVARANGLAVQETPPITATGAQPGVAGWQPPPELGPLLKTAFDRAPDEDPAVETIVPDQRFAILAIGRVVPAAPPQLAQIAPIVKADLVRRRAAERARSVATALVAKINAGVPAARAFAEADVRLPAPERVQARRVDIAQPNRPVPPPLAMMFSLPKGKARLLPAPGGQGWFVVHLENRIPGDARSAPGLVQATMSQFQRFIGEEYAQQFGRAVEKLQDIERNEDAIRRTRRQLLGAAAPQ
ncbi:MAG: peptidyl-prolyl cis-trans isomerase [Pseudomonadota bacterium]|nr:peptidyl-prolyl cis-trans isomerase [Pseudomonadota bacterium]